MEKSQEVVLGVEELERRATRLEMEDDFDPEYAHALGQAIGNVRDGVWDGAISIKDGFKAYHKPKV
jgi:hypothetical protein